MKILNLYLTVLFTILFLFSCSPFDKVSRSIKRETRKDANSYIRFIANQKDTINSIFIFRENNHFELILKRAFLQTPDHKYFSGQYHESNDRISLNFYKNYAPDYMAEYLLKDTGRKYLMYPLKNGSRTIMLELKYKN